MGVCVNSTNFSLSLMYCQLKNLFYYLTLSLLSCIILFSIKVIIAIYIIQSRNFAKIFSLLLEILSLFLSNFHIPFPLSTISSYNFVCCLHRTISDSSFLKIFQCFVNFSKSLRCFHFFILQPISIHNLCQHSNSSQLFYYSFVVFIFSIIYAYFSLLSVKIPAPFSFIRLRVFTQNS